MQGATTISQKLFAYHIISIHAPVQGATFQLESRKYLKNISIHAPVQGATLLGIRKSTEISISIHAPVQGATKLIPSRDQPLVFQSTLPCRERHPRLFSRFQNQKHFNPRSRAGSDVAYYFQFIFISIFQSTLPCRERQAPTVMVGRCNFISIHAPVQGATEIQSAHGRNICHFNPRSRAGSDIFCVFALQKHRYFNPRSRAGSDPRCALRNLGILTFQSTLPCRERQQKHTNNQFNFLII